MPKGGKLTIETANVVLDENFARLHAPLEPGEYVVLSLSDTGTGMDAETQSHMFEPFFTTKGPKGTGLGLSMVYGIIKQSGGYIWAESDVGKGTAFRIYLPRATQLEEPAAVQPAATIAAPRPNIETILVVEDEENLRHLARQYLQSLGYTVLEAPNGSTAIQVCSEHSGPIHLLLTDVIMPGMNGRELAQRIISLRPDTRVLYMSGYTENVIGHNGMLEAGVNLLQKPFTLPALKAKVREVLDTELSPEEAVMSARTQEIPSHGSKKFPPFRAQRFNLHLPLRYRKIGEQNWRKGTTENISRSGVLFRGEEVLQPTVQLEINLVLPPEIAGLAPTEVVCRGEVVRTVQSADTKVSPALAAKILQYRFHHGSQIAEA
jgi:CheY-like chemotaxis protein